MVDFKEAGGPKPPASSYTDSPMWENLASYHCPFCDHPIEENEQILMFFCEHCDFKISTERYGEILEGLEDEY